MNTYFILGSNSFSGQDLVRLLLTDPKAKVIGISRSPEKSPNERSYSNCENFIFEQCNIRNTPKLISLYDYYKPNYIVNFAAQSEVLQSWETPINWYNTNIIAISRFIDHISTCVNYKIKKFLQISTPEVYGSTEQEDSAGIFENNCYNPSTPYAASKASIDLILNAYQKSLALPIVYVRSANIYGKYQQIHKIIPKTIASIKLGRKIPLHGDGLCRRCFIHISDVSRGELLLLHNGEPGTICHLATNTMYSIKEVVQEICKLMNVNFSDVTQCKKSRTGSDFAYHLCNDVAIKDMGWHYVHEKLYLQEIIDWIQSLPNDYLSTRLEYSHIHE